MPGRRLKVRKIREVLRYHLECGLSMDKTAAALDLSKGSVHRIINFFSNPAKSGHYHRNFRILIWKSCCMK